MSPWWPLLELRILGTGRFHQPVPKLNTLRPRQDGRDFPDDIFLCIFLNENEWHSIKISLKFVPKVPINNIPVLVQIMAWRRPGDKPLSEPMMVVLPTHTCGIRSQWVKGSWSALKKITGYQDCSSSDGHQVIYLMHYTFRTHNSQHRT